MKFKMIIFAGIVLLVVLAIGAASAAENLNSSDTDTIDELAVDDDVICEENSDDVLEAASDDDYVNEQDVSNLKTASQSVNITVPNSSVYKSGGMISLNLPSNATGALVILKEGSEFKRINLTNGLANFSVDELGVGSPLIEVKYDGGDYDVVPFSGRINILPLITIPSKMTVGENKFIEFVLDPAAKGRFIVEADTVNYASVVPTNGYAKVSLAKLDDSDVKIEIEYHGEDGSFFNWTNIVEVMSVKTKIIAKNVKMTYLDGTTFKMTVYGTNGRFAEKGEVVDVKMGKKEYSATVGSKGVATLKIKVAPGKYKVKASYGGTTIKKTLTVKHALKLKKANVKRSAGKVVLKATLKKGKKPIKGKKVTFRFNGKKIKTVKTNKKGLAKAVVKAKLLKNLKAGKKVKIQAKYYKDIAKMTVKVK